MFFVISEYEPGSSWESMRLVPDTDIMRTKRNSFRGAANHRTYSRSNNPNGYCEVFNCQINLLCRYRTRKTAF